MAFFEDCRILHGTLVLDAKDTWSRILRLLLHSSWHNTSMLASDSLGKTWVQVSVLVPWCNFLIDIGEHWGSCSCENILCSSKHCFPVRMRRHLAATTVHWQISRWGGDLREESRCRILGTQLHQCWVFVSSSLLSYRLRLFVRKLGKIQRWTNWEIFALPSLLCCVF